MKTQIVSSVIVLFLLSFAVQSQSNWKERRDDGNQRERIKEGWRSGEITPREFGQLSMEQRKLHRSEMRMERDGRVEPGERCRLQEMRRHCSRDIWRDKHNAERRFR